jgi:hypothetical protein
MSDGVLTRQVLAKTFMGVYLVGVYLVGVHLTGVHLKGVHLMGVCPRRCVPHRRASYRHASLTGMRLVGVHVHPHGGVWDLIFRKFSFSLCLAVVGAGFPKNLFPPIESLHHTLIKHREMMIPIS